MKRLWSVVVTSALVAASALAATPPNEQAIKDADGKTLALLVMCNVCKASDAAPKKGCDSGVQDGWLGDKPCGQCLLKANAEARVTYPYDLHFTGKLVDAGGKPVKNRFVKIFTTNGWNSRTRTSDDGAFRLMFGAVGARQSKTPLIVDLGTRVDSTKNNEEQYTIYMLPESYKPCLPGDAPKAAVQKAYGKKSKKK